MTGPRIAILSMACRFPEADTPAALWQNVQEGRRSFRRVPSERLPLEDYTVERVGIADSIPPILAGLISDWDFDRSRFRVPRTTFEATDLTHWLALETADDALAALGGAEALPSDRCITVIGNTLTGEFTRSSQIRLRLPYLNRVLQHALATTDLPDSAKAEIVREFSAGIRSDFMDPNEESLAGALANTIAGRIANHNDFHGGAWTVDGACASSLLALSDACTRLSDGSADVAIAGGVDLSLDPFELVGFARAGALARDVMRVFDRRASGFWPGEGCGMAVLATEDSARALGAEPLAWIRGWGVSTDGAGGLTRPTERGQERTLRRAWSRAGLSPEQAGFFEAHGTGTAVGDPIEIRGLAALVGGDAQNIPVGSIKANIGHCKAAAGMAGFIKSVEALRAGQTPAHVSCEDPASVFGEIGHRLVPAEASDLRGVTAGVSGFGFGGVNAHIVLEQATPPATLSAPAPHLPQDCELFLLSGETSQALKAQLQTLSERAQSASLSELRDLAARPAQTTSAYRAAIVARRPKDLIAQIEQLLAQGAASPMPEKPPRIGFLFPGQAAPVRPSGGIWARRFRKLSETLGLENTSGTDGELDTAIAQPTIVHASLLAARVLETLGIQATVACGHSLGEISALAWGGALSPKAAHVLARARGAAMSQYGRPNGGMVRVPVIKAEALELGRRHNLVLACENGVEDMVLAGSKEAIASLVQVQPQAEILKVSHAFHSPDMIPAAQRFSEVLEDVRLAKPTSKILSSVTGRFHGDDLTDLRSALLDQFTQPVVFASCLETLLSQVDLVIEVGPGAGLTRLAEARGLHCVSVDAGGSSLGPLLQAVADVWLAGGTVDTGALFADRPCREISKTLPRFLANPCGLDGDQPQTETLALAPSVPDMPETNRPVLASGGTNDPVDVVQEVAAQELGLEVAAIPPDARLLDDLHLNSLSVGRIVDAAAARLGIAPPAAATDLAQVSIAELAAHLEELRVHAPAQPKVGPPEGVRDWVVEFQTEWCESPLRPTDRIRPWAVYGSSADLRCPNDPTAPRALVVMEQTREAPALSSAAALLLWQRVQQARENGQTALTILHSGMALSGFARSLLAEGVFAAVAIVDVAQTSDCQTGLRYAEAVDVSFAELKLDGARAMAPQLAVRPASRQGTVEITQNDCVFVTGGGRGIAAECALDLARATGCAIVLAGRSAPESDAIKTLKLRASEQGISLKYCQLDLRNRSDVVRTFESLRADGNGPSVIVHAAGVNRPDAFGKVSEDALRETLDPKVEGLCALLKACDPAETRLVVGFGSIIGALGLPGETHYALANDIQSAELIEWGAKTGCRVLALDWSVWAGAGMGERLGVVERLASSGVQAIPLTSALVRFRDLVQSAEANGRMIVTSRFGPPDHAVFQQITTPPTGRFIGDTPLHFPGVELINDVVLTTGNDPWLEDHMIEGRAIVPGVMLLEAMAQTVAQLMGWQARGISDLHFDHAVSAASDGTVRLRIAALRRDDGGVDLVIRAGEDDYLADRARATLWPNAIDLSPPVVTPETSFSAQPLYDALWFNTGRFARLESIETARSKSLRARFTAGAMPHFFGAFQVQDLTLGDPGLRDAGLHALQLCVAQRRVLPVSVERIAVLQTEKLPETIEAVERSSDGTRFCFDLVWRASDGEATEIWTGAWFHAVASLSVTGLPNDALPPLLERAISLAGAKLNVRVVLSRQTPQGLAHLGLVPLTARGDGAPQDAGGENLSRSRASGYVLSVSSEHQVACDLVDWKDSPPPALTRRDQVSAERLHGMGLPEVQAKAVIWAGRECMRKAGAGLTTELVAHAVGPDNVIALRSGGLQMVGVALVGGLAAVVAFDPTSENRAPARSLSELGATE